MEKLLVVLPFTVFMQKRYQHVACPLLVFNFYTKFMKFSGPISKYVTDASYWIYLIHFPLTIWISGGLMNVQIGVYSKFLIVVMLTMTASLITYQLFVRSSWFGCIVEWQEVGWETRSFCSTNGIGLCRLW